MACLQGPPQAAFATKATGTDFSHQQPAGDTPGVAAAPVALAGAIVPGVATLIVTLSAHAAVFGVGITATVGSMLVTARSGTVGWIVPGGRLLGMSGVESGKAAPLVGGPPGVELHTVVDELPSGDTGDMVPVALPTIVVGMVPKGFDGIVVGSIVVEEEFDVVGGAAETVGIVPVAPPTADMEVICTVGVPGAICPVGVEQATTVPGIVGSEASGTGASVVSGVPGWVVAENGPGPFSGEVTIVAGVDGSPMAVLPMVETWATQTVQFASRVAAVNSKRRMATALLRTDLACLRLMHGDLAALRQVDHRIKDHLIAGPDAIVHFDLLAEVARDRNLLQMGGAVLDHRDMQSVLIEYDGIGWNDH